MLKHHKKPSLALEIRRVRSETRAGAIDDLSQCNSSLLCQFVGKHNRK